MLIRESLIAASAARFKAEKVGQQQRPAALADGPRGQRFDDSRRRDLYRKLIDTTGDAQLATRTLERIIAGNDLVGISYLALGMRAARSVGRVHLCDSANHLVGYGTGFLVAPGVMMTNNHVIGSDLAAATASIEFDYELDPDGHDKPSELFALDPASGFVTDHRLDFTLVAVAPRGNRGQAIGRYGWLSLRPRPGKSFEGEYLTIVQHPGGERKQICARENKLLKYGDDTLWYQTDTVAGSSGSPAFNGFWEVVALHHSGIPATDAKGRYLAVDGRPWDSSMDETRIKWIANEGIRISRIVEFLRQQSADEPAAKRTLAASDSAAPPPPEVLHDDAAPAGRLSPDGRSLTITVPVTLSIGLGGLGAPAPSSAPSVAATARPPVVPADDASPGIENVVIDQSNYDRRPGFDSAFLGTGKLAVPLPKLSAALRRNAVRLTEGAGADPTLLRYYNYSAVMNGARRLAFYSAVNIDGPQRRDVGKREGDRWYIDKRIPEKFQVGESFYNAVVLDEAKRTRVFDRGHLVRRLDATWGPTAAEAKRNGDDTFHFTNCTPQHWQFNEQKQFWAGIEDYVLAKVENADRRACVINGPVFRNDDDKRAGVAIPRQFFKIAVFAKGGKLAAAGFLLSQADLLARDLPKEEALKPPTDRQAAVFQVKIAQIAKLTGLDFGPLAAADAAMAAFEAAVRARTLMSLDDIVI